MEKVTIEQVMQAVKEHNITRFALRRCSICYHQLAYYISGDFVSYDSSCECTNRWESSPRTWDDLVRAFNMQTPEVREKMWQQFITKSPAPQI